VDEDKCIGCGLCQKACPWDMMSFDREKQKASKCFLCDGEPKCVKACPAAALTYMPWKDRSGEPARRPTHGYLPEENANQCSVCHG
jgi:Fe-S-cluster-containing dehydrogenase component